MNKQDMTYKTPYAESDEYVDALVKSATEKAIAQGKGKKGKKRIILTLTSIGAAAACIAIALNMSHVTDSGKWTKENAGKNIAKASISKAVNETNTSDSGPLDKFMAKASDDDHLLRIRRDT